MSNLYVALMVCGTMLGIMVAIVGAIVFTCDRRVRVARAKEKIWYERAEQLQHIIDGYGMRNLQIGERKGVDK